MSTAKAEKFIENQKKHKVAGENPDGLKAWSRKQRDDDWADMTDAERDYVRTQLGYVGRDAP